MLAYILRRLFWFIPVFFVVTALTFWTVRALPGGPFDFAGERELPEHVVRNIKRKYGLDKPIWQQYLSYLVDLTRLDFGVSFKYRDREVSQVLGLQLVQIKQVEAEADLRRTEGGGFAVYDPDLDKEYPLEPGLIVTLRDGTEVKMNEQGDQITIEQRKEVLLELPLRPLPLTEGGLAVWEDGDLITLEDGVSVELDDGAVVERQGGVVVARKGDLDVRLSETRALRPAVLTAAGEEEKLEQEGVGYGIGSDYFVRLAPDNPYPLVNRAVMQFTLEPVLVVRVAPGEVVLLEEGKPVNLSSGTAVIRRGGMVTLTTSMGADELLEQTDFDMPVLRMLAAGDGRGNLVPLDAGTDVKLPDGTEISGQGDVVVVRKGDIRIEISEEGGNLRLHADGETKALSDRAVEQEGLLVLSEENRVSVMEEVIRVPLVRLMGVEREDGTVERLDEGDSVELIDDTRLTNREGQIVAKRRGEELVLGWTRAGRLAVVEGPLITELREAQRVELDKYTYVTVERDTVMMQRRFDLPIKYTLYPQEDGGWNVSAPGADEAKALEEGGRRAEFPGDLTVRWRDGVFEGRIRRVSTEGKVGLPISGKLGLFAMAIALGLGIPLGIVAALKHNTVIDYGATLFAILGVSVPTMVLGPVLILVFVHQLDLVNLSWTGGFANYILPAFSLGTAYSASIARLTRASLLQVIREDYIRTARAKGLAGRTVVIRHALKNSLIPVVTVLGPMFAGIVTGSMVTEQIFAIPGMGKHFVTSIGNRDYPILMAVTIIYAVLIVMANLAVDITYGILDPRIRYQ